MSKTDLLFQALKQVSTCRRAADARKISVDALAEYERVTKRERLLARLSALPSSKGIDAATQRRLYEEAKRT